MEDRDFNKIVESIYDYNESRKFLYQGSSPTRAATFALEETFEMFDIGDGKSPKDFARQLVEDLKLKEKEIKDKRELVDAKVDIIVYMFGELMKDIIDSLKKNGDEVSKHNVLELIHLSFKNVTSSNLKKSFNVDNWEKNIKGDGWEKPFIPICMKDYYNEIKNN